MDHGPVDAPSMGVVGQYLGMGEGQAHDRPHSLTMDQQNGPLVGRRSIGYHPYVRLSPILFHCNVSK